MTESMESRLFREFILTHLKGLSIREYGREKKKPYVILKFSDKQLFLTPLVEVSEDGAKTFMKVRARAQIDESLIPGFRKYLNNKTNQESFLERLSKSPTLQLRNLTSKMKNQIKLGHMERLEPVIEKEDIILGYVFNNTIKKGNIRRKMAYSTVRFILEAFIKMSGKAHDHRGPYDR